MIRFSALARDALAVVAGLILCAALVAGTTNMSMSAMSGGKLLSLAQTVHDDPEALSAAVAKYGDPFALLETVQSELDLLAFAVALIVGAVVAVLASSTRAWLSLLSLLPMIAIRALAEPASPKSWLFAGAWALAGYASASLVMRWRRGRQSFRI